MRKEESSSLPALLLIWEWDIFLSNIYPRRKLFYRTENRHTAFKIILWKGVNLERFNRAPRSRVLNYWSRVESGQQMNRCAKDFWIETILSSNVKKEGTLNSKRKRYIYKKRWRYKQARNQDDFNDWLIFIHRKKYNSDFLWGDMSVSSLQWIQNFPVLATLKKTHGWDTFLWRRFSL